MEREEKREGGRRKGKGNVGLTRIFEVEKKEIVVTDSQDLPTHDHIWTMCLS